VVNSLPHLLTDATVPPEVFHKFIEGITCYSIFKLLLQKKSLNRPKDQEDIRKLKIAYRQSGKS